MVDIKDLIRLQKVLNISGVAQQVSINQNTLRGKIKRGTELTVKESEVITQLFHDYFDEILSKGQNK